jgi:hypothetical protein
LWVLVAADAARPLCRAAFEIYERGFEKRSVATIGALVKLARSSLNWRARKHA